MIARPLAVALFVAGALAPSVARAQATVVVRDAGPGRLGRLVQDALTRPHVVVAGDSADLVLARDAAYGRSLVVIGRDVRIAGAVDGDLVVVGGDVFLRPGARIDGDVITAGGGIYDSYLAVVRGNRHAFRDETMVATALPGGGYALDYEALRTREFATFSLPGIYGIGIPSYDRVNGVSLPGGPSIRLDSGRVTVEPTLTYRTHLGKIDPGVAGTAELSRRMRLELVAARTSRTNEEWIAGDFSNSLAAIWSGRDKRNWYRADMAEATLHRAYETPVGILTPYVGAQWERAWTTGIQDPPRHLAWSVTQRTDTIEGMARPNPVVDAGAIASAVAGFEGEWAWKPQELEVRASGRLEGAPRVFGDRRFAQLTLDGRVEFPLVRSVMFRFEWHGVGTAGDAPPQRFAYLGGSGTIRTLDLLAQGGDQLVYTESRAWMPLEQVRLPFVGSPTVMVRHMMGSAGVGRLPALTHNLGVRVSLMLVRGEFVVDPASGETDVSFGVSFSR
jgi:hypothetical protein